MAGTRYLLAVSAAAACVLISALTAVASPADRRCGECHFRSGPAAQNGRTVSIDSGRFSGTAHAAIGCSTCHDHVSAGHPSDGLRPPRPGCRECHGPVYGEYAGSLHASRAVCSDCHNPHDARLPIYMSGEQINGKCARCHDVRKTISSHAAWLPQADLHIDSLLCITCHTGSRDYVITMFIESRGISKGSRFNVATYEELAAAARGKGVGTLVDGDGDGFVSLRELRQFNRQLRGRNMRLWGVMTPETVTHTYQILDNRWDCSFCHASGAKALQKSYVALPDGRGGFRRLPVEKGAILDMLYGTPDFYMLGTTRSRALNIIGAVIVAAGMSFPLCHGFFRVLTRKSRKGQGHDA